MPSCQSRRNSMRARACSPKATRARPPSVCAQSCPRAVSRLGSRVDEARLDSRLQRVQSRIPRLRKREKMTRPELGDELRDALGALTDETVAAELVGQLPADDLVGLAPRIRAVLFPLVEQLEGTRG